MSTEPTGPPDREQTRRAVAAWLCERDGFAVVNDATLESRLTDADQVISLAAAGIAAELRAHPEVRTLTWQYAATYIENTRSTR